MALRARREGVKAETAQWQLTGFGENAGAVVVRPFSRRPLPPLSSVSAGLSGGRVPRPAALHHWRAGSHGFVRAQHHQSDHTAHTRLTSHPLSDERSH